MGFIASIIGPPAAVIVALVAVLGGTAAPAAFAAECGGSTPCHCGDTITTDYTMTSDLGPCPRVPDPGADTVGLSLKSGVTLNCQGHVIAGPGDSRKDAFGIRVGNTLTPTPASDVTITNCGVTRFWWGIYVQNARNVLIDSSRLYENGWKVPVENGSGYGLDVANSRDVTLRDSLISDNGNEGVHLSSSSAVTVERNVFSSNGLEQLYLFHADHNVIRHNRAEGGSQGLEMRYSSSNDFSYNVWAGSAAQVLEDGNSNNTFYYDSFEGRVYLSGGSVGNVFGLCEFKNPTGTCLATGAPDSAYVYKGYFRACASDLGTSSRVTLDRSVNNLAKVPKGVTIMYPGCTADLDLDADVDADDRGILLAAMNSVIGDANWNPEADLDHDGDVDGDDLLILESQLGPCTADLAVTAVSDPPPTAVPGSKFSVTDTVRNLSKFSAAASRTQYYLSLDSRKDGGSKLLSGRSVPGLGPDGISKGTVLVTIPATTLAGVYVLLACADDKGDVAEADESNNCRAAAVRVQVGRPDLVLTAVSDPPPNAVTGSSFPVTDTVQNQGVLAAGASRTQYYLSRDPLRNGGDRLLSGSRSVPSLDPDEASTGTVHVTIPVATLPGAYFVLACADARGAIAEGAETDNCRASASKVMVNR